MGAEIGHRFDPKDKDKETPYSDMRKYLNLEEYIAIAGKNAQAAPQTTQGAAAPSPPEKTAVESAPSPWD